MLNKFRIALVAFALASCSDEYRFGTPQFEKETVTITLKTFQTREEFTEFLKVKNSQYALESNKLDPVTTLAFSETTFGGDECTIYMVHPEVEYSSSTIGHEALHCFYGQWHTDNQSFR